MKSKLLSNPVVWIFLWALLIRLMGVSWGLPNELRAFSLHPDEQVNLMYAREIVPTQLKFTPGNYSYGTLYLTVLRITSDIVLTYGGGMDSVGNISLAAMGQVHLAGRILNCLFGAGVAALTFGIGRRVLSVHGAYIAGGLVAVAPALVVHSRFQTVDMLATMLAIASVYACIRLIEPQAPAMKWALLAGLFAGMSAGTKYVGFVAIVALIPACLHVKKPVLLVYGLLVAIGAFVVTTPGCILDKERFVSGFLFELNHSKEGHGVVFMGTSPALIYHIANLSSGASILTFLLGVGGLGYSVFTRNAWAIILTSFFVVYYLAVSGGQIKFMRYILPLIPVLALGVGFVVHKVVESGKEKLGLALGLLVLGGADTGSLVRTGPLTYKMLSTDPRDIAGKWLKDKGDVTIGLASDPWYWSPSIHPEMGVTRIVGQKNLLELWASWDKPKVAVYIPPDPRDRYSWDVKLLTEIKPEYVVASSFEYVPYNRLSKLKSGNEIETLLGSRYLEFKAILERDYEMVPKKEFPENDDNHNEMVEDMEYVQPNVIIWQRKKISTNP